MFFHPVDAEWQTTARIALNLNENIIRHDLITQDSKLKQLLAELSKFNQLSVTATVISDAYQFPFPAFKTTTG